MALNGSWDVNYGLHALQNGPNIPLATTASPQSVTFYYDHKTHWVTENVSSIIATVPGSFQSEIGCSGDWDPGCFRSWLQDIQGTGIYSFSTNAIPAGSYEAKVALNGNWDVNYGQGGVQNGPNIAFTVPANDMEVAFQWNSTTKDLRIIVGGIRGDLTKAQAYWLSADTIAWNVPTDTVVSLFADPDGALTLDGPGIVAAPNSKSWALTHDPAGLSAELKAPFPAPREPRGIQVAARGGRGGGPQSERSAGDWRGSLRPGRRCHRRCKYPGFSTTCIQRRRPGHAGTQLQARADDAARVGTDRPRHESARLRRLETATLSRLTR